MSDKRVTDAILALLQANTNLSPASIAAIESAIEGGGPLVCVREEKCSECGGVVGRDFWVKIGDDYYCYECGVKLVNEDTLAQQRSRQGQATR